MAGNNDSSGGIISGINVTPLVDIMLVLLIVFMVTARLVTPPPPALQVNLPKAASGDAVQIVFAVGLTAAGAVTLNGQPADSDARIIAAAHDVVVQHPDAKAVIQADAHAYHEQVIHLMDLLSQAGITQIAFAVQIPPNGAPQ